MNPNNGGSEVEDAIYQMRSEEAPRPQGNSVMRHTFTHSLYCLLLPPPPSPRLPSCLANHCSHHHSHPALQHLPPNWLSLCFLVNSTLYYHSKAGKIPYQHCMSYEKGIMYRQFLSLGKKDVEQKVHSQEDTLSPHRNMRKLLLLLQILLLLNECGWSRKQNYNTSAFKCGRR